jgi:hypothetical protein
LVDRAGAPASPPTRIVDGRAHKAHGFDKPREEWNVLIPDHHAGYISWQEYEDNQRLLLENAHTKKLCARKSARGGRALLIGLMRCGRCGRMMRVFYGSGKGHAHRTWAEAVPRCQDCQVRPAGMKRLSKSGPSSCHPLKWFSPSS